MLAGVSPVCPPKERVSDGPWKGERWNEEQTSFTSLSANEIDTSSDRFGDMAWMPDHIHDGDFGFMKLIDNFLRWDTDSADKELGALLDDDLDKFRKLSLGIVVLQCGVSLRLGVDVAGM